MAIKALNLSQTRDYVSKYDDGDEPTIWKLGTVSSRDVGAIRDSVTSFSFKGGDKGEGDTEAEVDTKIEKSKMNFEAVRRGLKGVENFMNAEGHAIPFKLVVRDVGGGVKRSVVPNDFLDCIPLAVIEELAGEILKENLEEHAEDENETGNSQEPSSDG